MKQFQTALIYECYLKYILKSIINYPLIKCIPIIMSLFNVLYNI
jgi:hypothetical protein